jgi:hypothetical protein
MSKCLINKCYVLNIHLHSKIIPIPRQYRLPSRAALVEGAEARTNGNRSLGEHGAGTCRRGKGGASIDKKTRKTPGLLFSNCHIDQGLAYIKSGLKHGEKETP